MFFHRRRHSVLLRENFPLQLFYAKASSCSRFSDLLWDILPLFYEGKFWSTGRRSSDILWPLSFVRKKIGFHRKNTFWSSIRNFMVFYDKNFLYSIREPWDETLIFIGKNYWPSIRRLSETKLLSSLERTTSLLSKDFLAF